MASYDEMPDEELWALSRTDEPSPDRSREKAVLPRVKPRSTGGYTF